MGLVEGGLPDGLIIPVGFVRSGNITAGISSIVVHVTSDGCVVVEVVVNILDKLHGRVAGLSDVLDQK